METKFRIEYDDQPNEVVDKVAGNVSKFGITINELDGGDGYCEYEITKTKEDILFNHSKREIFEKYDIDFNNERDRQYYTEQCFLAMQRYADQETAALKDEIKKLQSDLQDANKQCDEERESKESLQCYRNELVEDIENWQAECKRLKEENIVLDAIKFDYDHAEVVKRANLFRIKELESTLTKIAKWELPTPKYETDYGSNGARDFIKNLAIEILLKDK